jgi:hypothetical protein
MARHSGSSLEVRGGAFRPSWHCRHGIASPCGTGPAGVLNAQSRIGAAHVRPHDAGREKHQRGRVVTRRNRYVIENVNAKRNILRDGNANDNVKIETLATGTCLRPTLRGDIKDEKISQSHQV